MIGVQYGQVENLEKRTSKKNDEKEYYQFQVDGTRCIAQEIPDGMNNGSVVRVQGVVSSSSKKETETVYMTLMVSSIQLVA